MRSLHLLYSGSEKGGAQRVAIECATHNSHLYTSSVKTGGLVKLLQEKSLRSFEFNKLILNDKFDVIFCSDPRALISSYLCLKSVFSKKFLILHSDKLIKHKLLLALFCRIFFVHFVCTTQTQVDAFKCLSKSVSLVRIVDVPIMKKPCKKTDNILYFGRFDKIKNIHEIIDIFSSARKEVDSLKLTLVGHGEEAPASVDGVDIISDWISQDELAKIMKDSSFVINATNYEGFSLQIMEGISNGLFPLVKSKGIISNYNLPEGCCLNVENVLEAVKMNDCNWSENIIKFQKSLHTYLQNTVHLKDYVKYETGC